MVACAFCCLGFLISHASREPSHLADAESVGLILGMNVIGTIIGVIVVLIFLGGFVAGRLFPSLGEISSAQVYWQMASAAIWAKLMVWSFIAGFSERMAPNLLSNFVFRIEQAKEPSGSAPRKCCSAEKS